MILIRADAITLVNGSNCERRDDSEDNSGNGGDNDKRK